MNSPVTTDPNTPVFQAPVDIPAQINPAPPAGRGKDPIPPATQTPPPAKPDAVVTEPEPTTVEIERFKAVQKIARDLEKEVKGLRDGASDAEAYRKIMAAIAPGNGDANGGAASDPMAAIQALRDELTGERTERLREKVAHDAGVPVSQVTGSDEEAMKAAAEAANSWAKAKVDELLKQAGIPLAAPAANVTSTDVPGAKGPQIQSRDELKNMTHQQITAAYKEGRMDKLLGK